MNADKIEKRLTQARDMGRAFHKLLIGLATDGTALEGFTDAWKALNEFSMTDIEIRFEENTEVYESIMNKITIPANPSKIPPIAYSNFKELEGKLNTAIIQLSNDKISLSFEELNDFIDAQKITSREKIHLALSAAFTIDTLLQKHFGIS